METVQGQHSQSQPLWERSKSQKGHHSAVEGALKAHRQRNMEREMRIERRHNIANGQPPKDSFSSSQQAQALHTQNRGQQPQQPMTAPGPQAPKESFMPSQTSLQEEMISRSTANSFAPPEAAKTPRLIDELHQEAQFMPAGERAMGMVGKDMSVPEQIMSDEIPKGSYVDYQV